MFRTHIRCSVKLIITALVLSLIVSFPAESFGTENDDSGNQAASGNDIFISEGQSPAEGSSEGTLSETTDPGTVNAESGNGTVTVPEDDDAAVTLQGEITEPEQAAQEQTEPEQTEPEQTEPDPEEEENIIAEYESITIWAKHKYTAAQPEGTSSPITRWMTTNPKVASVSNAGVITARSLGVAIVQGFDDKERFRKSIKVVVKLGRDYTLFVAHKGYSAIAPENTLPAFKTAVRAGFGGVEFDIWESKTTSKKAIPCILVIHDKNLKTKTGKKMKAYKLNRQNRSKYKIRKNVNGIKKYGPQKIPTIEEALNCIYKEGKAAKRDIVVEIDVKGSLSNRAVKRIIKLVGRHHVHIISPKLSTLKQFKKYRKYKSTELWYCTESNLKSKRNSAIKSAGKSGFNGISLPYRNMSKATIKLAKSYGMKIGGYGINDAASVQQWVNAGCSRFNMNSKVFQ